MKTQIYLFLLLCFLSIDTKAQEYVIDSLFANNGIFQTNVIGTHLNSELTIYQNNEIFITGRDYRLWWWIGITGDYSNLSQVKINSCGSFDTLYGMNGKFNEDIYQIYPEKFKFNQDKSSFVIGSKHEEYWSYPYLSKINSQGHLDSSFQIQPLSSYASATLGSNYAGRFLNIDLDSINQKIFCIGTYHNPNEKGVLFMNFNMDGSIDSSLYSAGKIETPIFLSNNQLLNRIEKAIKIDEDRYLICGISDYQDSLILTMINKFGLVDSSFGNNGIVIETPVNITSQASVIDMFAETISDQIFISTKEQVNNRTVFNTRKYNNNGLIDLNFGNLGTFQVMPDSGYYYSFQMKKILEDKLIISNLGYYYTIDSTIDDHGDFFLLNDDGTINNDYYFQFNNSTFNENNHLINDIIIASDDKIYITGANSNNKLSVIRLTSNNLVPNLNINGDSIISNSSSTSYSEYQWVVNGNLMENATGPNILISNIGEYILTVIDTISCGQYSDTLYIESVNYKLVDSQKVKVFPIPAIDEVNLLSDYRIGNISISDITGRSIYRNSINSNSTIINIAYLNPGIYFIKTDNETVKIIKR